MQSPEGKGKRRPSPYPPIYQHIVTVVYRMPPVHPERRRQGDAALPAAQRSPIQAICSANKVFSKQNRTVLWTILDIPMWPWTLNGGSSGGFPTILFPVRTVGWDVEAVQRQHPFSLAQIGEK